MKTLLLSFIFLSITFFSFGQASNTWSVKFSDAIKTRYTPTINNMTSKGWEYSNTIITHGMEKVYNLVNDASYLAYIKAYVDLYVNSGGAISATINSLDRIHPGISVLFLYEKLKSNASDSLKYKTAATTIRNILVGPSATYPKTAIGGIFWHKNNGSYNDIVMLDGIYMGHPFLAKYGSIFGDNAAIDTAVNQTLFLYNQLYDNTTHLIKHAWNPTKTQTWANATTGNSTSVWSRAMGWYMMALVDILKYVPPAHPKRAQLLTALNNLAIGIQTYQDAGSGLWYHVVDKNATTLPGNYLETSGSAMFVYALKTAVNNGWISAATYLPVAQGGWTGLQAKIDNYTDGKPRINDFSPAMSVQNTEALYVQASLQPVDVPVASGTQHPHGYAAILMAGSVMEFSLTTLPVKFTSFAAKEYNDKVRLSWQNADESEVAHYEIQKSINGIDFTVIGTTSATGLSTYTFDDNAIESKKAYYRINAVSFNRSTNYSAIISINKSKMKFEMKVAPNPVENGLLNVYLTSVDQGDYTIKLISSAGQLIETRSIIVKDESIVTNISLPATTIKGIYFVQLEGGGLKINKTIMVR
jgi:unsaturated rhamnogalacturonyl hydrolase